MEISELQQAVFWIFNQSDTRIHLHVGGAAFVHRMH